MAGGTPRDDPASAVGTPRLQSSLRLGAEAMLSGAPARAAYKRAMVTGMNPPQTWPELMKPAGLPWTDLQNPRGSQHAGVTEFLAMQHAAGGKHLSESALHGGRSTHIVAKPIPPVEVPTGQKLKVGIISARGLPNRDSGKVREGEIRSANTGLSDPFCTCEILGKPHSKAETKIVGDSLNPVWNQDVCVLDFSAGDALTFRVWDSDQDTRYGDLLGVVTLQSHQFYPRGFESELPLANPGEDTQAFLRVAIPDMSQMEEQLNLYGGAFPADELTEKYVRKFMLCARRLGARGFPRLFQILKAAAAPDGSLDEQSFTKVSIAEGLCVFFEGCGRIFHHFQRVGGGTVRVDALMAAARGIISKSRLEAVREVWKQLDPQGRDYIEAAELMAAFNPDRLPAVRFDGVTADMARREYLEGLGACRFTVECKNNAFALEEAADGRRPLPVGSPRREMRVPHHVSVHVAGGPIVTAAGKAGTHFASRRHGDFIEEVQARPLRVPQDAQVSATQFEEFYAALSHGISDDRLFERTLREPWTSRRQLHEESIARRFDMSPRRKISPKGPQFRIAATFADGTKRVVKLSNIDGLSESIGQAGVHCSQMWTWGPDIKAEVIRRLEAEGVSGVVQVKSIPC